jgi:hypothetical protein
MKEDASVQRGVCVEGVRIFGAKAHNKYINDLALVTVCLFAGSLF